MGERKNYAKFRRELKALCPWMGEKELYLAWWKYQCQNEAWNIHQTPVRGLDGKYYFVYFTETEMHEIYVGVHATYDLDDGYNGSGDEIRQLKENGVKMTTTMLEFFRTRAEALAMESIVVDRSFLTEPGVLNRTPGGDDTRHVDSPKPIFVPPPTSMSGVVNKLPPVKQVKVDMPFGETVEVPVMTAKEEPAKQEKKVAQKPAPAKPVEQTRKAKDYWPFVRLGIPIGETLEYAPNPAITVKVAASYSQVIYKGERRKLTELTKELAIGCRVSNTLNFWRWKGRLLIDIAAELKEKGG